MGDVVHKTGWYGKLAQEQAADRNQFGTNQILLEVQFSAKNKQFKLAQQVGTQWQVLELPVNDNAEKSEVLIHSVSTIQKISKPADQLWATECWFAV